MPPNTTTTRPRRAATVRTVNGDKIVVRAGVIDEDTRRAYTQGQCHRLAAALHRATGWPIYVLLDPQLDWISIDDDLAVRRAADAGAPVPARYVDELWSHAVVRRPDGYLVDIHGARTPDTVTAEQTRVLDGRARPDDAVYRQRLVPIDAGLAATLPSTAPDSSGAAEMLVAAVLALPDADPRPWPWQHSLTAWIAERLDGARECAEEDGEPFAYYAQDVLAELDEMALLHDALTRDMLPAELAAAARTILAGGQD